MPSIPWSRFSEEFLGLYGPPFGAKATLAKYNQILREFGEIVRKTGEVSPGVVALWIMAHTDRAPITNLNLLKHFRCATRYMVARKYLSTCPFSIRPVSKWIAVDLEDDQDEADSPDESSEVRRHLSIDEIKRVLDSLGTPESLATWQGARIHALASLVAYTGVRKMEALMAEVSDFDLRMGVFRIRARGRRLKTKKSAAPIPLPPPLIPILEGWLPQTQSRWAFPGTRRITAWTGGMPGSKPQDCLKSAGLKVGVHGFGFLALRHSWATHAERWGLTELEIQRVLRHTSPITAKKWYRHADLPNLKAAVRTVSFEEESPGGPARTV